MSPPPEPAAPRPRLGDHLQVVGLLLVTLAGALPFLVYLPLSPILKPWLRARARRALRAGRHALATPPAVQAALCAGKTVFVVAGEASGDRLAAAVLARMKAACPGVRVRGYAGPACTQAGATLDREITESAVFGFFGVVFSLGTWWRLCAETLARWRADKPDLLLTVDFPGLNVRLARWARRRGIRTVHLVAPQLWAHTPWRIFRWRRAVDLVLATFPFEPALFARSGLATRYVGHPLFEAPLPAPRAAPAWPEEGPATIELWPGSRRRELARHVRPLLEAAADLDDWRGDLRFVVRLAKPEHAALFETHRADARREPRALHFAPGAPAVAAPVLGALAASGTATAQLAADLVPTAILYRIGFVEWCFAQALVTAPWIGLANLVLGRAVLPERLCWRGGIGPALARDFRLVAGERSAWQVTRDALVEVRARLEAPGVADRAARMVLAALAQERSGPAALQ